MKLTRLAILARFKGHDQQAAEYCYGVANNARLSLQTREEYDDLKRFFLAKLITRPGLEL